MQKILFLDFDGVLFDTVSEAYYVIQHTLHYKNKNFSPQVFEAFKSLRYLVGPAWHYYFIMKAIEKKEPLLDSNSFIKNAKVQRFEEDFFETRKKLKSKDYKSWLTLNQKFSFTDQLTQIIHNSEFIIYIITTKDKQTICDLLNEFQITWVKDNHILDKNSFQQFGSKRNIILHLLSQQKTEYKAIFIDDSYEHLHKCEGIPNLTLVQPEWGYINKTHQSKYIQNLHNTLNIIQNIETKDIV